MNRAQAMLAALDRAGFRGSIDHDLVRLEPPAGLACVALGPDADGYLVSVTLSGPAFEHRPADTLAHRAARKALYAWSAELRNACALAWPGIERYPVPDPGPIEPIPAPVIVPEYRPRTDLEIVACEVKDRAVSGRVHVARAASEACGTLTAWADSPVRV
jgi:hypothetical protein